MHETYLRRAIALATENVAAGRGGPFGALIVHGGEVLASGVNQVTAAHDPTAHAEIVAIRAACARLGHFELRGCTIYASCEPCPMCLGAIYWARLDALWFAATRADAAAAGFDDEVLYEQLPLPAEARALATRALLSQEGQAPFAAWRESPLRVAY